jgi:NitT/TauT family transport system substrate-binding protein
LSEIGVTPDQYTAIATGAGPSAVAALRTGKIDALVMWDAMLGAAENTGLALRVVNIPLEDRMVGTNEVIRQHKRKGAWRLLPRHDQGPCLYYDE